MKPTVLPLLSLCLFSAAHAQQWDARYENQPSNIRYESSNPTRLSHNAVGNHAAAVVSYGTEGGRFHAASEAGAMHGLGVSIEGLRRIDKLDLAGHIRYDNRKENRRSWQSTLWLDSQNPFVLCDSVQSNFTTEAFSLGATASYRFTDRIRGGLDLGLQLGTMSNQTDPRPKMHTSVIPITAGAEYELSSRWAIGLSAGVELYHSDVNYTLVNPLNNHAFFLMKGMGDYYMLSSGNTSGYSRRYRGTTWNGALQAVWTRNAWSNFAQLQFVTGNQNATDGGSAYTFRGGDYSQSGILLTDRVQLKKDDTRHNLVLNAGYRSGKGTWYDQKRVVDTEHANRVYYIILNKDKVDHYTLLSLSALYGLDFLKNGRRDLFFEAGAAWNHSSRKHYLSDGTPKQDIGTLDLSISGAKVFSIRKASLLAQLGAGYTLPTANTYANGSNYGDDDGITLAYTRRQFEHATASSARVSLLVDARMPVNPSLSAGAYVKGNARFYTGSEEHWEGFASTSRSSLEAGLYLNF